MYISLPPSRNALAGWGTSSGKSGWGRSVRLPDQKPSGFAAVIQKKAETPAPAPVKKEPPAPAQEPAPTQEPLPIEDPGPPPEIDLTTMPDYYATTQQPSGGINKTLLIGGGVAAAALVAVFTLMD